MANVRPLLDKITATTQDLKQARAGRELHPSREEVLGYAFKIGEEAFDTVSKRKVKIIDATRAQYVKREE